MGVGIDIGSKTVKIVELKEKKENWVLKASGVVGYKGIVPEQAKDDKELFPLVSAVRKLFKEAKISSKEVAVSVPEQHVFIRTIKFPLLTDAEVASAVRWEAEQYVPFPVKDAIIQHQVIERVEGETPPQVVVLLIAVPTTLVEKYIKAVEMSGLKPVAIESELMAAVRSLAPSEQTALIVDLGARSTDIAVAKNKILAFSRSINIAGEALTRAVAQFLGVTEQQAEEYKRTYGLLGNQLEGKIKMALDPTFKSIIDEIKKAIHFYQAEQKGSSPESVILTGGSAMMPEITSVIAGSISLETIIGNPFSKVEVDPQAAKSLSGYAPLYSIAVGLAMKGF